MISIDLPWPARNLHPNSRPHWANKAGSTKAARRAAYLMAKSVSVGKIDGEVFKVTATFAPPNNHARDDDGMLSSIKAYLDGIADALGIDDSRFRSPVVLREPKRPGGNVRIQIEQADTWEHISEPIGHVIAAIPIPKRDAA